MEKRKVSRVIKAPNVRMGSMQLKQPLPYGSIDQVDPFLLLHHLGPFHQESGVKSVMELGAHPHRGFEPVTFVFEGELHHRDSRGNDSKISAGGVQWMTAGMGIVHSEDASQEFVNKGGDLEVIQLWVNLPSHLKMSQPNYQGFQADQIPSIVKDGTKINVISGSFEGATGPISSLTGVTAYTIKHTANSSILFKIASEENALIYQLNGLSSINGVETGDNKMLTFQSSGDIIQIDGLSDGTLLIVAGSPIQEEVVQHGPFVMNNQTEILKAMRDYQMGKMGVLI